MVNVREDAVIFHLILVLIVALVRGAYDFGELQVTLILEDLLSFEIGPSPLRRNVRGIFWPPMAHRFGHLIPYCVLGHDLHSLPSL